MKELIKECVMKTEFKNSETKGHMQQQNNEERGKKRSK
jgi:hypothetical protein